MAQFAAHLTALRESSTGGRWRKSIEAMRYLRPVPVVQNTGETKAISGYPCTKYVASEDGKTVLVAWTTKDVKGFEGLRDDWLAYQTRLEGTNPTLGNAIAKAYAEIEGFPMETEMGDIKTVVTKVEPRTTAASEFEVPAGYKQESVKLPKPAQR